MFFFGLSAAWPSSTFDWQQHHSPRIHALAAALRAGVIFPRWFPDLTAGYGEPVLNYYAPGFYYPPALLLLTGLDMVLCVRLILAVGFALSALWMFRLARLYVSLWPAVVSVACFQFYPFSPDRILQTRRFPWIRRLYVAAADRLLHDTGSNGTVAAQTTEQTLGRRGALRICRFWSRPVWPGLH